MIEDVRYRIQHVPHGPGLGAYVVIDKMLGVEVYGPDTLAACQRWCSRQWIPAAA